MPGKRCTVCTHPDRPRIDLALATGLTLKRVAERFGLSKDACWRHQQHCLTPELRAALALKLIRKQGDTRAVLLEEGASTVEALRAIRGPLFGRFLTAVDLGDDRAVAALASRLHEGLAMSAKLAGELLPAARTTITNIVISQDYQRLRGELLQVLRRFPEAQRAVADVFRRTGERAADEMQRGVPRPVIEAHAAEVADAAA
jgi:hypothetical protein